METIDQVNLNRHNQQQSSEDTAFNEGANETKASKRNKGYDLSDVRYFTERNADIDYKILLALYEHRALTAAQLKRGWFPTLHENSIRNRTKTLAERRILTVNVKAGIKTRPIKMYSLSAFGLRIVTENILQVMEYVPLLDEKKEHYTIDDLKVRSQHYHHFELQEWVIGIRAKWPEMFHCEWRRFPFLDELENAIRVKPDWLFLEGDEETLSLTRDHSTNNPLLYPFLYRKSMFKHSSFSPTLCLECDRGTMSRTELVEKWEGYRSLPNKYKAQAIAVFYNNKNNSDMRHRLIRDTLRHAFELDVIGNEVHLFQGDEHLTQRAASLYFERGKELLKDEEMTDEKELITLIEAYARSLERGDVFLLDVDKTVQHLHLPVSPDSIIAKQQESTSLHFVFFALAGWVNPLIKIQSIKRLLKEGHLSQFSDIKYILLYPDKSFLEDIRPMDEDVYYVSYQEVKENKAWGKAHQEQRRHRQVKWLEVLL
ncbi:replication-relaxation family protein (plasmid) [Cytobacillus oceanisediminis]|uniref:replication-relaxation family protein n=1 Tax=Cytobacillus oceanisediminis TaxID=665099 RepID=UPI001864AA37|nr:replication-relaxation family protein [Cytobacillus oceanisediminis]QOK29995.1 replication-relaxation family protein [Cytobacillus oceanisediminis]